MNKEDNGIEITALKRTRELHFNGYLDEGTNVSYTITFNETEELLNISISLTWWDEPDIEILWNRSNNTPDQFKLEIVYDNITQYSKTGANQHTKEGRINISSIEFNNTVVNPKNIYINVYMVDAGWYEHTAPPGITTNDWDWGNEFYCNISYSYLSEVIKK